MSTGEKHETESPTGLAALWKAHPFVVIFCVWLLAMLPLGFSVWNSGPSQVQEIATARDGQGVVAGEPREFTLSAGPHGVWVTVPEGSTTTWPEGTISIIFPGGERRNPLPPNGSSIRLSSEGKVTLLAGVFRAPAEGPYVLVVRPGAEGAPVANFGPAWADGDGVGTSTGFLSLSLMWVVTAACGVVAFRASQRKRSETLPLPKEADSTT